MQRIAKIAVTIAFVAAVGLSARPALGQNEDQRRQFEERRAQLTKELLAQFDLANPQIPIENLHAGCPKKDCIPALTAPRRVPAREATYPESGGRVIVVEVKGEAVAYPIAMMNFHEVVNDEVGGTPVAVTFCPLCDSAAILVRRYADDNGEEHTLNFGVAGFLLYSNQVLYDKESNGLWSQVFMRAITGPLSGTQLEYIPEKVMTFAQFQQRYPRGSVLSKDTGFDFPYDRNVYERYLASPDVPPQFAFEFDGRLPAKTRGAGIEGEGFAIFVPADAMGDKDLQVNTLGGPVVVRRNEAGVETVSAPRGVRVIQTFYHSFSAFHKGCEIYSVK